MPVDLTTLTSPKQILGFFFFLAVSNRKTEFLRKTKKLIWNEEESEIEGAFLIWEIQHRKFLTVNWNI